MANKLKESLRQGKVTNGFWLDLCDPALVEIMGYVGYDFAVICMEHIARDLSNMEDLVKVADMVGVTPLVRVGEINESLIQRVLDSGAAGVIAPHVTSKKEAERLVRACRYPPRGVRGASIARAQHFVYEPTEWMRFVRQADEDVFVGVIIEDVQGVENVEEILSTDGIDCICPGPGDLSFDLGVPGDLQHPSVEAAVDRIMQAASKNPTRGLMVYIPTTRVTEFVKKGANMIAPGHDVVVIRDAYEKTLKAIREGAREAGRAS